MDLIDLIYFTLGYVGCVFVTRGLTGEWHFHIHDGRDDAAL